MARMPARNPAAPVRLVKMTGQVVLVDQVALERWLSSIPC